MEINFRFKLTLRFEVLISRCEEIPKLQLENE